MQQQHLLVTACGQAAKQPAIASNRPSADPSAASSADAHSGDTSRPNSTTAHRWPENTQNNLEIVELLEHSHTQGLVASAGGLVDRALPDFNE